MSFRTMQTIKRAAAVGGYGADGKPIKPTTSDIGVMMSIQPLNKGEQSQYTDLLESGGTRRQAVKTYSKVEIIATQDGKNPKQGDKLTWNGKTFVCVACDPWLSGVVSHYKAIFKEATS